MVEWRKTASEQQQINGSAFEKSVCLHEYHVLYGIYSCMQVCMRACVCVKLICLAGTLQLKQCWGLSIMI